MASPLSKRQALQAALNGDTTPLKSMVATLGQPYTDDEVEHQRQYLTQLYGREATRQETVTFFGRYDKSATVGGACYVLPNGMRLCF